MDGEDAFTHMIGVCVHFGGGRADGSQGREIHGQFATAPRQAPKGSHQERLRPLDPKLGADYDRRMHGRWGRVSHGLCYRERNMRVANGPGAARKRGDLDGSSQDPAMSWAFSQARHAHSKIAHWHEIYDRILANHA